MLKSLIGHCDRIKCQQCYFLLSYTDKLRKMNTTKCKYELRTYPKITTTGYSLHPSVQLFHNLEEKITLNSNPLRIRRFPDWSSSQPNLYKNIETANINTNPSYTSNKRHLGKYLSFKQRYPNYLKKDLYQIL